MHIYCHDSQNSATSNCSKLLPQLDTVFPMGIKHAIKANIERLTSSAPEQWARSVSYLSGKQKGKPVAPRTIRNAMNPDHNEMPSTALIEALASHFDVIPAELIVDWDEDRAKLLERVLHGHQMDLQRPRKLVVTPRPPILSRAAKAPEKSKP